MICPACHVSLDADLHCARCGTTYPRVDGIADFSGGTYYDSFDPATTTLPREHLEALQLEIDGSRRRIADFYGPLLRRTAPDAHRVLDCGCGNGVSVDALAELGYDAWGNDVSQLRRWQWRERASKAKLVVASALRLPFEDGFFDAVISSGVIEHIGVAETALPRYAVTPLPDRDAQRAAFLRELARVVRPGGTIFLDTPNGAFPIDFWHGTNPGSARWHSPREGFLPTFAEIRALIPGATVTAHAPKGRLQFRQASRHWYGRILRWPMAAWFSMMSAMPALAATRLNPFLVVRISRPATEGATTSRDAARR